MTATMQDKLLAEITRVITAAGLEATRQPQYANTGIIYAQHGFDTYLAVRYDFQDRYCRFGLTGTAVDKAPPAGRGRSPQAQYRERGSGDSAYGEIECHYVEYHKGDAVRAVLDLTRDLLAPWAPAPPPEPGPDDLCYPRLVVADTRHGYVYTAGPAGLPFTDETAPAFADQLNAAPGVSGGQPHRVFRLAPDTGSPAVAFIALVAAMPLDGEQTEHGRPYEQQPGDAAAALQSLITRARAIRAGQPS